MKQLRITVKGRGLEARVTIAAEPYRGKVWVAPFDSPFTSEATFDPAQADSSAKEARRHNKDVGK